MVLGRGIGKTSYVHMNYRNCPAEQGQKSEKKMVRRYNTQRGRLDNTGNSYTYYIMPGMSLTCCVAFYCSSWTVGENTVMFMEGKPAGNTIRDLSLGGLLGPTEHEGNICAQSSVMTLLPCRCNFELLGKLNQLQSFPPALTQTMAIQEQELSGDR